MGQCNHEDADTRVLVHLQALQSSSLGMIYTGDTDVVILLFSTFHHITPVNPTAEVWISFKAGKAMKIISLNILASTLGETTCKAMALFHAFTGSESTSSFKFKGKRYCFKTKSKVQNLMEAFATATSTPSHTSPELKKVSMEFVYKLYSNEFNNTGDANNVDLMRMKMFCQKTRDVERIPPTSYALELHLRSVFQASIWVTAHNPIIPIQDPCNHRWIEKGNKLIPVWTTLPLAKDVFNLQVT